MKMRLLVVALVIVSPLLFATVGAAEKNRSPLIVHEWGTFTSLQDEKGEPIGGINTDDEPVPGFVRRLTTGFLLSPSEAPPVFFQGAPRCHPDVTMRLETPVLYFYPAPGWTPRSIDVHVAFRGGWLTEYYPSAEARAPGFDAANPNRVFAVEEHHDRHWIHRFGRLRADAPGQLSWKGVTLEATGAGPQTEDKVWLAPRAVKSSMLQTPRGEREKFLFYRGVGNVRASLQVMRNDAQKTLELRGDPSLRGDPAAIDATPINAAWLVDVREDGACAFRTLGTLPASAGARATVPAEFPATEFGPKRLAQLQTEMRDALVTDGLFPDEAEALLRTWEVSYFKAPGLRLFYLCGASDIERLLPLQISVPCEIKRVMIGRIEIVTPEQRALLAKIAIGPALELWRMRGVTGDSQSDWFKNPDNMRRWNEVMSGRAPYRDLGLPIPELYATYLKLGRFRNALLLDEQKRRPTPPLKEYITTNRFDAYEVP
jgi:hypothetical protein